MADPKGWFGARGGRGERCVVGGDGGAASS